MKKLNKKGFTIVELVIVIAVIAILSAVLIPTFSSIITKANKSNADQAAKNASTVFLSEQDNGQLPAGTIFVYAEEDGKTYYEYVMEDGVFTYKKGQNTVIDANDKIYGKAAFDAAKLKKAFTEDVPYLEANYTVLEDLGKNVYIVVPVA